MASNTQDFPPEAFSGVPGFDGRMVNATVTRLTARAAALVLIVSAFAGGAAAAGADADLREGTADASVADDGDAPKTTACLQFYWEQSVGPVTVVYHCGLQAEIDEDWEPSDELPIAATSGGEPACFDIYDEQSVGPVTHEATSSCDHQVTVDEDSSASTIPPCGSGSETTVGPVTAGYDPYCQIYVDVDEDWRPSDETSKPDCYYVYIGVEAGPVTVSLPSTCSATVDVDEDWEPSDESSQLDHMSPSDNPVKCFLDADSGVERWACFFGPPGP